jgi:cytidylate kinase
MKGLVITIDGPAASGKGSLSKKISKDLNFFYLETGAYYRALACVFVKKKDVDINNLDSKDVEYFFKNKSYLYSEEISNLASKLAKLKHVRQFILDMQRNIIITLNKKFNGILLEGRDCGTVIAPEANLKIFLTADISVRAKRRYEQFVEDKRNISYEQVLKDLNDRDRRDKNRKHSPLKKAEDAVTIDNTKYNFEETINIVKKLIFSRIPTLKNKN